jgi:hypothetical protein
VIGCLTAPFRALGCLVLLALLVAGWLYRDRVVREAHRLLDRVEAPAAPAVGAPAPAAGRPGTRALASARAKLDSLNSWRADSVVLTPSEVASLMGSALAPAVRQELDSLRVELLENEVLVHARLRTAKLPKDALGPLALALRPTEPVEVGGPLRVTTPGHGEWVVRSFRIRDFPVPAPAVPHLVSRALGDPGRETVPLKLPAGIRAIAIHPGRATLHGAPRP